MAGVADFVIRLSNWLASPWGQFGVPLLCIAWLAAGFPEGTLTLVLSILALTFSQLVIGGQRRFEAAVQAKLDEILFSFPEARDELLRVEERPEQEIEQIRRG